MHRYTDVRRIIPVLGIISVTLFLLASGLTPVLSCASEKDTSDPMPPGTWGGRGAELRVVESSAEVEFNCALGRIPMPITLDAEGGFAADGLYFIEPGGPGRAGDREPAGLAAIFSGTLRQSELELTVRITKTGRTIGPFYLYQSQESELEKCL